MKKTKTKKMLKKKQKRKKNLWENRPLEAANKKEEVLIKVGKCEIHFASAKIWE